MSAQHVNPVEPVRILGDVRARRAVDITGDLPAYRRGARRPRLALASALSAEPIPARRFVVATGGSVHEFHPAAEA